MITNFTPFITKGTTKYDWKQESIVQDLLQRNEKG